MVRRLVAGPELNRDLVIQVLLSGASLAPSIRAMRIAAAASTYACRSILRVPEGLQVTRWAAPLALLLAGCTSENDVRRISNDAGLVAVDIGQAGTTRRICIMHASDRGPCTSEVADLIVNDLTSPGQVAIRWRQSEPAILDVVMFGGEIDRCRQPPSGIKARMIVRSLPLARMPAPEDWTLSGVFTDASQGRRVCGDEPSGLDNSRTGSRPKAKPRAV